MTHVAAPLLFSLPPCLPPPPPPPSSSSSSSGSLLLRRIIPCVHASTSASIASSVDSTRWILLCSSSFSVMLSDCHQIRSFLSAVRLLFAAWRRSSICSKSAQL